MESEFEGTGLTRAGVWPNAKEKLTAEERRKLMMRTAQDQDAFAEPSADALAGRDPDKVRDYPYGN